jgi:DNA-binding NarL/FixJ family response regulator
MNSDKLTVLIADDHKIIRIGLRGIIQKEKDIVVAGEASNGDEVLAFLKETVVDVVLMDIDMGHTNGIETTKKIKELYPEIHILALTMHEEEEYIIEMLEAGASGYLLKDTDSVDLITALNTVAKGDSYYSQKVSASLLKALTNLRTAPSTKPRKDIPLSEREIEVLRMIAQEYTNGEIAEKLFISIRTVDTHRRNILEKLQVKNTAGLVKYALENALI